jgi:hypothetical protein
MMNNLCLQWKRVIMRKCKKTRRLSLGLLSLVLFLPSISNASEVQERLTLWRNHIVTKGNIGGVEYDSDHYRTLVKIGPNSLPEVFSAYRKEEDPHVLYYYSGLIGKIAHFDFFRYSEKPLNIHGYEYQCMGDKPFLSILVGKYGISDLPHPQYIMITKEKLIRWWDQRKQFLQRTETVDKIRTIIGRQHEEFLKYNKIIAREFSKLHVYGIYNIPYYIDLIDQDNNPIVFCDFLRISNHPEFQNIEMTNDVVLNTWKANSKFPTRESKIALICDWWDKVGKSYIGIDDLYVKIDSHVKKLRKKSLKDSSKK